MKRYFVVAAVMAGALVGSSPPVQAKAADVKKAQALGFTDIKTCTACHVAAKGGKELNARGQFLVDKKKETGATEIDLAWLKDYKEAK
jgi:hypothetical protein